MRMGVRGKRFFVFPMCITVQSMALVRIFRGDKRLIREKNAFISFTWHWKKKRDSDMYVYIFSLKHKHRNKIFLFKKKRRWNIKAKWLLFLLNGLKHILSWRRILDPELIYTTAHIPTNAINMMEERLSFLAYEKEWSKYA